MAAGAACTRLVVQCPGIETAEAIVALLEPSVTPTRTLFAHSGGGGQDFYGVYVDAALAAGVRVALVRWPTDWEQTASSGILAAACRPATVMKWVFDNPHQAREADAFCGVGFSGGAGALGYALAHYGMGSVLDYAAIIAGPPFSRLDYGCAPATYTGPQLNLCPELTNAPFDVPAAKINAWSNTATCRAPSPSPNEVAIWAANSIVSPGAAYDYPKTLVTFWNCANQPDGNAGGAQFYAREIISARESTCFTVCTGENIGVPGRDAVTADLLARCTPR